MLSARDVGEEPLEDRPEAQQLAPVQGGEGGEDRPAVRGQVSSTLRRSALEIARVKSRCCTSPADVRARPEILHRYLGV